MYVLYMRANADPYLPSLYPDDFNVADVARGLSLEQARLSRLVLERGESPSLSLSESRRSLLEVPRLPGEPEAGMCVYVPTSSFLPSLCPMPLVSAPQTNYLIINPTPEWQLRRSASLSMSASQVRSRVCAVSSAVFCVARHAHTPC